MGFRQCLAGFIAVSVVSQSGMAAGTTDFNMSANPSSILGQSGLTKGSQAVFVEGIYKAKADLFLAPVRIQGLEDLTEEDMAGTVMEYPEGETLHIRQFNDELLGETLYEITAVVNPDEDQFPSVIYVKADELKNAELEFVKEGSVATLEQEYSPFDDTELAAKGKGSAKRRKGKKIGSCYRMVKFYLLKTGKVKSYLPGGSAYMAAGILPKHGFRRTGSGPSGASIGDVCVYRGGWHGHGHIEVKVAGGWYFGPTTRAPIQGRKFIGCFRK